MTVASDDKKNDSNDNEMHLTDHLEELRKRLIIVCVAVALATVASYYFAEKIFALLMQPLLAVMPADNGLIFTGLTEAFFTYLKIALLAGFFISSPVFIYQCWRFAAPGLYANEKKYVFPFVFFAIAKAMATPSLFLSILPLSAVWTLLIWLVSVV